MSQTFVRRHRWLVAAGAATVVAIGAAVGFRAWLTKPPTTVTVSDAIGQYRSSSSSSSSSGGSGVPPAGVYSYATTGSETVDAMGGDTHDYPALTALIVTETPCGYRLTWTPLAGRSDTTDLCVAEGAVSIAGTTNEHEFFHISQGEQFTCEPGAWWVPPDGTTTWTATCRSAERTTTRTAHVVGDEQVTVGTGARTALHVHFDDVLAGGSTGTSTQDLWLDPSTGLPLREVSSATTSNDTIVGRVTFRESIDMTLLSAVPQQ